MVRKQTDGHCRLNEASETRDGVSRMQGPHNSLEEAVPGSDVRWEGMKQNPPTEDSHCQVTCNNTLHKPMLTHKCLPMGFLPHCLVLLQT